MTSRVFKAVLLGAAIGAAGIAASVLPPVIDLEEGLGLSVLFRLRGVSKPPPDVAIVSVDRRSSDALGLPDDLRKWPRSLHARLTEALVRQGASVIAFDMYFEEPRDPKDDRAMAEAFAKAGNVVVCRRLHAEWVSRPRQGGGGPDELRVLSEISSMPSVAGSAVLAPFPLPKVPLKVSKTWTFVSSAGEETPTLPVAALHLHSRPAWEAFVRAAERAGAAKGPKGPRGTGEALSRKNIGAVAGDLRGAFERDSRLAGRVREELEREAVPGGESTKRIARALVALYDGPATAYLAFYGPARTIPTIPYSAVLSSSAPEAPGGRTLGLRGKAVFVGLSESSQMDQKDGFPTVFTDARGLDLSGVEIAATAFANFLSERPVRPLGLLPLLAFVFLWGVFAGVMSLAPRPVVSAGILVAASAGYASFAVFRFSAAGTWYPVVVPVIFQVPAAWLAAMAWNFIDLSRDRTRVRSALAHYLPPDAVERISRAISGPGAGHRVVHGVCLATDGERYTALAEAMDPKELGAFMNRYYEAVFDPVRRHGGTVSNVVGDSMLAIWVDPSEEGAAARAGRAAVEIDRAQNGADAPEGDAVMPTRIGLHAGPIFLGDIGGGDHYEYRPFGDIVNTATRIEGLNKRLGTRILASDDVAARLSGFLTRPVGEFLLAGKSRPVRVHEVMARDGGTAGQRSVLAAFSRGMDAFRRRAWEEAERSFREASEAGGGDGPSLFYWNLCARYRDDPPGADWEGAVPVDKS